MSVTAESLQKSGRYRALHAGSREIVRVRSLKELRRVLDPASPFVPPFRPAGAGSAATDCNSTSRGTLLDMTSLDAITNVDARNGLVTAQAGVRLRDLVDALAQEGMELEGSHDLLDRTAGGAVASGCIGPAIGKEGAQFASQVVSLKLVTPGGRLLTVDGRKQHLLAACRLSYGMLGVIYEVTLRTRPVTGFQAMHRCVTVDQFSAAVEKLVRTRVGLKFFILPFRDRVYLDIRRFDAAGANGASLPWRIKDWGESTLLPNVFRSLNRVIPVAGVRYRLMDRLSTTMQGMVNGRLVSSGSNATVRSGGTHPGKLRYSTWIFPATDFAIVVKAYREFSERIRQATGFRCDLPTIGYRLNRDRSALLSPSYDEPMVALRAVTTPVAGWEDFAIDFGEFARHWGAAPLFNQSQELDPAYARQVLGPRLEFFRRLRRQLDPENRMMNPFLSQYFL